VIGVAKDVRSANPTRIDPDRVYVTPRPADLNAILFRVRKNSPSALAAVRKMVQSVNADLLPGLLLVNIEEGPLKLKQSLIQGLTVVVIVLACIALIIAATGIYSVMAHLVSRRVKEIGIRIALGATPERVLRSVVLPGLRPVLAGLVIGSAGALGLSWFMHTTLTLPESSDFFYGVPFYDPVTFLGLSCFVVAIAALASLVPARRALNVDPMVALREE
jgi:macrolide transport system ATP-binding/permease protein